MADYNDDHKKYRQEVLAVLRQNGYTDNDSIFNADMDDDNRRREFYNYLQGEGLTDDFATFSANIGKTTDANRPKATNASSFYGNLTGALKSTNDQIAQYNAANPASNVAPEPQNPTVNNTPAVDNVTVNENNSQDNQEWLDNLKTQAGDFVNAAVKEPITKVGEFLKKPIAAIEKYTKEAPYSYATGEQVYEIENRDWIGTKNPKIPYVQLVKDKDSDDTYYIDRQTGERLADSARMPEVKKETWNLKDAFVGKSFSEQADEELRKQYGDNYLSRTDFVDGNGKPISGQDVLDSLTEQKMTSFYYNIFGDDGQGGGGMFNETNMGILNNLVSDAERWEEERSTTAAKEYFKNNNVYNYYPQPTEESYFNPNKFENQIQMIKGNLVHQAGEFAKKIEKENGIKKDFALNKMREIIDGVVDSKVYEVYKKRYGVHSDAEFICIGALENTMLGKLALHNSPESAKNIRKDFMAEYAKNAGSLANLAQFGLTLLGDAPMFAGFGTIAGQTAKITMATIGEIFPKLPSATKVIRYLMSKGLSQEAAANTYKAIYATSLGTRLSTNVGEKLLSSGLTLGQYEGWGSVLDGGNFFTGKTVVGEDGKETTEGGFLSGLKTGAVFGTFHHVASALTYGLEGSARVLGYAGGIMGEAAVLTGMDEIDAYISGQKNLKDFLFDTVKNIPKVFVMRYSNGEIGKNILKLRENIKNGFRDVSPLELNADNYSELVENGHDITKLYVEPENTRFNRQDVSGIKNGEKAAEILDNRDEYEKQFKAILNDPHVSIETKHKIEYLFGGKMTLSNPYEMRSETTTTNDGRFKVTTYNGKDECVSVRYFADANSAREFTAKLDKKFEVDKINTNIAKTIVADIVSRGKATEKELTDMFSGGIRDRKGNIDEKRTKELAEEIQETTNRLVNGSAPYRHMRKQLDTSMSVNDDYNTLKTPEGRKVAFTDGINELDSSELSHVHSDGTIHTAVMRDGSEVHVVEGDIALDPTTGAIDETASSDKIVYVGADGKPHIAAPKDFDSVLEPLSIKDYLKGKDKKTQGSKEVQTTNNAQGEQQVAEQTPATGEYVKPLEEGASYDAIYNGNNSTIVIDSDNNNGTFNATLEDLTTGEEYTLTNVSEDELRSYLGADMQERVAVEENNPPQNNQEQIDTLSEKYEGVEFIDEDGEAFKFVGADVDDNGAYLKFESEDSEWSIHVDDKEDMQTLQKNLYLTDARKNIYEAKAKQDADIAAQADAIISKQKQEQAQRQAALNRQREQEAKQRQRIADIKNGMKTDDAAAQDKIAEQQKAIEANAPANRFNEMAQFRGGDRKKAAADVDATIESLIKKQKKHLDKLAAPIDYSDPNAMAKLTDEKKKADAFQEQIDYWNSVKSVYTQEQEAKKAKMKAEIAAKEEADRKAAEEAAAKRKAEKEAEIAAAQAAHAKAILLPNGKPVNEQYEKELHTKGTVDDAIRYLNTRYNLQGVNEIINKHLDSMNPDEFNFWKEVSKEQERITTPRDAADVINVDEISSKPATDAEVSELIESGEISPVALAGHYLSAGNWNKESVLKETGYNTSDLKGYVGMYVNEGGKTINKMAHDLWEGYPSIYATDMDAKNALIEALSTCRTKGDLRKMANDEAVAIRPDTRGDDISAENYRQQDIASKLGYENYNDFVADEENAIPAYIQAMGNVDEKELSQHIADSLEQLNKQYESNDNGATEEGNNVLPTEQTGNTTGNENDAAEGVGGTMPVQNEETPGAAEESRRSNQPQNEIDIDVANRNRYEDLGNRILEIDQRLFDIEDELEYADVSGRRNELVLEREVLMQELEDASAEYLGLKGVVVKGVEPYTVDWYENKGKSFKWLEGYEYGEQERGWYGFETEDDCVYFLERSKDYNNGDLWDYLEGNGITEQAVKDLYDGYVQAIRDRLKMLTQSNVSDADVVINYNKDFADKADEKSGQETIYVGNYYFTEGARETARGIKKGDKKSIKKAAKEMAKKLPNHPVTLVPIPSHNGYATYTLELANAIKEEADKNGYGKGVIVENLLFSDSREELYAAKKQGKEVEVSFTKTGEPQQGREILLVDNVEATGYTIQKAKEALTGDGSSDYGRGRGFVFARDTTEGRGEYMLAEAPEWREIAKLRKLKEVRGLSDSEEERLEELMGGCGYVDFDEEGNFVRPDSGEMFNEYDFPDYAWDFVQENIKKGEEDAQKILNENSNIDWYRAKGKSKKWLEGYSGGLNDAESVDMQTAKELREWLDVYEEYGDNGLRDYLFDETRNEDELKDVYEGHVQAVKDKLESLTRKEKYGKKNADLSKNKTKKLHYTEENVNFAKEPDKQQKWIEDNLDTLIQDYLDSLAKRETGKNVFDPDEVRKLLAPIGYDGNDVASFKEKAEILNEAILDKMLERAVDKGNGTLTLMSGLPGSGKSFAAKTHSERLKLESRGVVVDRPFNSLNSIKELYDKAKAAGITDIRMVAVYCDPVKNVSHIISRGKNTGRWTPIDYWKGCFDKQIGKLAKVMELMPDIQISAIENTADGQCIFHEDANNSLYWSFELSEEQKEQISKILYDDETIPEQFKEATEGVIPRISQKILGADGQGVSGESQANSGGVRQKVRNVERKGYTLEKRKHTKTGEDLYAVNFEERMSASDFKEAKKKAKELGGYYSSFKSNSGFLFPTEEAAERFARTIQGKQTVKDSMINAAQKEVASIMDNKEAPVRPEIELIAEPTADVQNNEIPKDPLLTEVVDKEYEEYLPGERITLKDGTQGTVAFVVHKGEQVGATSFSKPRVERYYLANGKRVNPDDVKGRYEAPKNNSDPLAEIVEGEPKGYAAEIEKQGAKNSENAGKQDSFTTEEEKPKTKNNKKADFSGNKIFTQDRYESALERLRKKLNQLNAGIDPELLEIGIEIAGAHIEKGVRNFKDFVLSLKETLGDLFEGFKPHIKTAYMGLMGSDSVPVEWLDEMDDARTVKKADIDVILKEANKPITVKPIKEIEYKKGDKVIYKGKEATVYAVNEDGRGKITLDTGLAPVLYEMVEPTDVTKPTSKPSGRADANPIAQVKKTVERIEKRQNAKKQVVNDVPDLFDLFADEQIKSEGERQIIPEKSISDKENNKDVAEETEKDVTLQQETTNPNLENYENVSGRSEVQNGYVREGVGQNAPGNERPRINGSSASNLVPDSIGSGRSDRFSEGEQEPLNQNNYRGKRGKDYAPTTPAARVDANIEAIQIMKQLIANGKMATKAQKDKLRLYTGWGGLGGFFESKRNSNNSSWWWTGTVANRERAEQISRLMTDDEYAAAVQSINSAYFTPAYVVDAMWDVAQALGVNGGNILEGSAGVGNMFAQMPEHIHNSSSLHGVEIDETTGNILKLLYPDAKIDIQGFEKTKIRNNSVDFAITNVPFVTGLHVVDPIDTDLSNKFGNIHDFCIAKNVRKLKQGGIGIFISSSGTMDKSSELRRWLVTEGHADIIDAFRLNNETFGGTSATSDIIVVRKRINDKKSPLAIEAQLVNTKTGEYEGNYDWHKGKNEVVKCSMSVNEYFVTHPENMAGEMKFGYEEGDTYRPGSAGLYAGKHNQKKEINAWVQRLAARISEAETSGEIVSEQVPINENPIYERTTEKEGKLHLDSNGKLCISQWGESVPLEVNSNKVAGYAKPECFNDYLSIKDAVNKLLETEANSTDDSSIESAMNDLNRAYDKFVNRYGYLNKNTKISFLRNDVDFPSIAALENVSETSQGITITKRDIFTNRVIGLEAEPHPTNIKDGLTTSLFLNNRIDVDYIAGQLGRTPDEVRKEILDGRLGFYNPISGEIEVKHVYLSGNVRQKLKQATLANENHELDANIEELQKAIPMTIPAHLIEFSLGSSWLPVEIFTDYMKDRCGGAYISNMRHLAGGWHGGDTMGYGELNKAFGVYSEICERQIWGTELIHAAMNNKSITVQMRRKIAKDAYETIVDKKATEQCNVRIQEIKDDFAEWARKKMLDDEKLSKEIEDTYNEKFNSIVPLKISEEFLPKKFPNANPRYTPYPHQRSAVVRAMSEPVMLAHEVGSGKTITLITTAMEMRRLGTAKKPMIVVHNATLGQFVSEAKDLYPNAKILTLTEKDKGEVNRRNFYAKIKYGDWDMIIIPQSTLDKIPDSIESQQKFIQKSIEDKLHVLEELKMAKDKSAEQIVKQMELEIENLQSDMSALSGGVPTVGKKKGKKNDAKTDAKATANAAAKAEKQLLRKTDDVGDFESLGVDAILIDEAHNYKHLGFATAMQRGVKGVDPTPSKRAASVYLKTRSILENNGWKNVVFATGTPISNTAGELWTFMKFMLPEDVMKENDIYYFDDFVRNFGKISQMLEHTTSGAFKENNRFAQYFNKPELIRLWAKVSDTVLSKDIKYVSDKIPDIQGGKAEDIFLDQTPSMRSVMKWVLSELARFEAMSGKEKKANSHIPLTMYGIAKRAAIDARLVDTYAKDEPGSKTNQAVANIIEDLKFTNDYKGTVAVFCDNYQRKPSSNNKGFNLFEDMKDKLIASGLKESEIAIVEGGGKWTPEKKAKLFDKLKSGEVRVVFGTTESIGTGSNFQERLHAMYHMDAPQRPMDYTQRNGRGLRQGNLHKEWDKPIRIVRFGVKDSLDVTAYQMLKTKSDFIDSIMDGKGALENNQIDRTVEEVDEGIFDNPVAMLSGSEYAMKKRQAEQEYRKYKRKKEQWEQDQKYVTNQLRTNKGQIKFYESVKAETEDQLDNISKVFPSGVFENITINGKKLTKEEDITKAFSEINKLVQDKADVLKNGVMFEDVIQLNFKVNGVDVVVTVNMEKNRKDLNSDYSIYKAIKYSIADVGIKDNKVKGGYVRGALTDIIENVITGAEAKERYQRAERNIESIERDNEILAAREGKPFEFGDKLVESKKLVDEYTKLMRQELEEKHKKYVNIDAQVEEHSVEAEDEDEGIYFRDGDDYIVSEQQDADYMEAVEKGDEDVQRELVEQAAQDAGYIIRAYHGTNADFNEFKEEYIGTSTDPGFYGEGFYFATTPESAEWYGNVMNVALRFDKPFDWQTIYDQSKKWDGEKADGAIRLWYGQATLFPEDMGNVSYGDGFSADWTIKEMKDWIDERAKTSDTPFQDFQDEYGIDDEWFEDLWESDINNPSLVTKTLKKYGYDGVINAGAENDEMVVFNPNNIKSAEPRTYDEYGKVIPLSERFNNETADIRFRTSDELDEEYPGWRNQSNPKGDKEGGHSTQISSTRKTYQKIGEWLIANNMQDADVLDASSGLGYGTLDMREMGINVEDVEPFQTTKRKNGEADTPPATYESYDEIDKQYDLVISNAVLNVIPDDWRADVLKNMADKVKVGGKMFINCLNNVSVSENTKILGTRPNGKPNEVLTMWDKDHYRSYQRIYSAKELAEYVREQLGEGWDIETAKKAGINSSDAIIVTRKFGNPMFRNQHPFKSGQVLNLHEGTIPFTHGGYKGFRFDGQQIMHDSKERALDALRDQYPDVAFIEENGKVVATPWSEILKPRKRTKSDVAYSQRTIKYAEKAIDDLAKQMHITDKVELIWDTSNLKGRRAKAKGWFDLKDGKIYIVMPNNRSRTDAVMTLLHEGVSHYGLRELFGDDFDTCLDNIYNNVTDDIRNMIDEKAKKDGDTRKATEELMAEIAETMEHDIKSKNASWMQRAWRVIKDNLIELLRKAGLRLGYKLNDNDLRYILWRSYRNMASKATKLERGNIKEAVKDIAKRDELGIGFVADSGFEPEPTGTDGGGSRTERGERNKFSSSKGGNTKGSLASIKAQHPGTLLFVEGKKSYRIYNDDAKALARTGVTNNERLKTGSDKNGKYVEIPASQFDKVLPMVIRSGNRVAIVQHVDINEDAVRFRDGDDELSKNTPNFVDEKKLSIEELIEKTPLEERRSTSYVNRHGHKTFGLYEIKDKVEEDIRIVKKELANSSARTNDDVQRRLADLVSLGAEIDNVIKKREDDIKKLKADYEVEADGSISLSNVRKLFDDLSKEMPKDDKLSELIEDVFDYVKDYTAQFKIVPFDEKGANTRYEDEIYFSEDWLASGASAYAKASTILHEMIHHMTMNVMGIYRTVALRRYLPKNLRDACADLQHIYNLVKKAKPKGNNGEVMYGAHTVYEMMSEMAKPEFREVLKNIKVDEYTAWEKIVRWVRDLFHLGNKSYGSDKNGLELAEEAMKVLSKNYSYVAEELDRTIGKVIRFPSYVIKGIKKGFRDFKVNTFDESETNSQSYADRMAEAKSIADNAIISLGNTARKFTPESQEEGRKAVKNYIKAALASKNMPEVGKRELNKIMAAVENVKNGRMLRKHLTAAETIVKDAEKNHTLAQINRLLTMKKQGRNNRNVSIAQSVDDRTRQIFNAIRTMTREILKSSVDDDINSATKEISNINKVIKTRLRELLKDNNEDFEPIDDEKPTRLRKERKEELINKYSDEKAEYEGEEYTLAELKNMADVADQKREELKFEKAEESSSHRATAAANAQSELDALMSKWQDEDAEFTEEDYVKAEALNILSRLNKAEMLETSIDGVNDNGEHSESIASLIKEKTRLEAENRQLRNDLHTANERDKDYIKQQIETNKEAIDNCMTAMNTVKEQQIHILHEAQEIMNGLIEEGRSRLKDILQAEHDRKSEIIKNAYDDIKTQKEWYQYDRKGNKIDTSKRKRMANLLHTLFATPLESFVYMSQKISNRLSGTGYIYRRFVEGDEGVVAAHSNHSAAMQRATEMLDSAAQRFMGMNAKKAADKLRSMNDKDCLQVTVNYLDKKGNVAENTYKLNKGTMMYISQLWNMKDGKMKLSTMGFTEDDIQEIRGFLGENLLNFCDWMVETYYPQLKERVNKVHKDIYHTSMNEVENYVPIRIDKQALTGQSNMVEGASGSYNESLQKKNNSIVNRTVNRMAIDLSRTALDVLAEHTNTNEEWIAYARIRQDLDYLLNSKAFRNQLNANSHGRYNDFENAVRVAVNLPAEPMNPVDGLANILSAGFVSGAISFKLNTALKQLLSFPAFVAYSQHPKFLMSLAKYAFTPYQNYKWAKENMPSFAKRIEDGLAGSSDVERELSALEDGFVKKSLTKYNKLGMLPNKIIDALTCAAGARSVYDFQYRRAKARGAEQEAAHAYAVRQADIAYNETQQSNVGSFKSAAQTTTRSWANRMTTVFQNANLLYTRKALLAMNDIFKRIRNHKRLVAQYAEDFNITQEEAAKEISNKIRKSVVSAALLGIIVKAIWDSGNDIISDALFSLFGYDDDDKKYVPEEEETEMTYIGNAVKYAGYLFQGTIGGNVMHDIPSAGSYNPFSILVQSEAGRVGDAYDKYGISTELATQILTAAGDISGFRMQTWANVYIAAEDLITNGADANAAIDIALILNMPKKTRERLVRKSNKSYSPIEFAKAMALARKLDNRDASMSILLGVSKLSDKKLAEIESEWQTANVGKENMKMFNEAKKQGAVLDKAAKYAKGIKDKSKMKPEEREAFESEYPNLTKVECKQLSNLKKAYDDAKSNAKTYYATGKTDDYERMVIEQGKIITDICDILKGGNVPDAIVERNILKNEKKQLDREKKYSE